MPRKSPVVLENQHGAVVQRVSEERARELESKGVAFRLTAGRLRLANQNDMGPSIERRTACTITSGQLKLAADVGFDRRGNEAGNYEARRIAAWPEIHDRRAPLAGGVA